MKTVFITLGFPGFSHWLHTKRRFELCSRMLETELFYCSPLLYWVPHHILALRSMMVIFSPNTYSEATPPHAALDAFSI